MHAIKKTLAMLTRQFYTNWELVAYDSGSTDGSAGVIKKFSPTTYIEEPVKNYKPGVALNAMVQAAMGEVVVFNNADCIPVGRKWLQNLISPLLGKQKDRPYAVFAQQVGHKKMRISLQRDLECAYGNGWKNRNWFHFFSLASSATMRSTALKYPFSPNFDYCEDVEWTYRLRQRFGRNAIGYCQRSVVLHDHNYSNYSLALRNFGEGLWLSKIFPIKHTFLYLLKFIPALFFHIVADYVFLFRVSSGNYRKLVSLDPVVYRVVSKCSYVLGVIRKWL